MDNSQKLAIAAHLHVVLRRKTGRVTDTEWMAENAEYAQAIVRFAIDKGRELRDAQLQELAVRLQAAYQVQTKPPREALLTIATRKLAEVQPWSLAGASHTEPVQDTLPGALSAMQMGDERDTGSGTDRDHFADSSFFDTLFGARSDKPAKPSAPSRYVGGIR
jgi:hypothetical protein